MHDTNIINIPFQSPYITHLGGVEFGLVADLQYFGVKSYGGIRFDVDTGKVEYYDIKHPFEKLPSSFADMAVKVYHHTKNTIPYIALNASPKFLQGHNVYGTDYVYELVCEMLGVLRDSYPVLWSFLDVQNAYFARIDVSIRRLQRTQRKSTPSSRASHSQRSSPSKCPIRHYHRPQRHHRQPKSWNRGRNWHNHHNHPKRYHHR